MLRLFNNAGMNDFVSDAHVALNNALHTPTILAALSRFGFDEARLQEGLVLLDEARARRTAQEQAYDKQYQATKALYDLRKQVDAQHYAVHRRLARLALKNQPERWRALRLSERKQSTLPAWADQTTAFYTHSLADPGILETFAEFNITQQDLEQALALVQQVSELKTVQEREKSAAQQATQARDNAFNALSELLIRFREVARIALADTPQLLESLQLGPVA
jgi:hypothetical protein